VGIDPDDDQHHAPAPTCLVTVTTPRWAVLLRAGQSLLEPRPSTRCPARCSPIVSHTEPAGWAAARVPPSTRTESGQTPDLPTIV
jgi:hypothetical protein